MPLITLSQKAKNLFDYQTPGVNLRLALKLKQIRLQPANSKTDVNNSISIPFCLITEYRHSDIGLRTSSYKHGTFNFY